MKKLIFVFLIAISTITHAQTAKKITSKPTEKKSKMATECYSTKERIPLTCVRIPEDNEPVKNKVPVKKEPSQKPKETNSKESKKTDPSDHK
jgi:hypothetical protein